MSTQKEEEAGLVMLTSLYLLEVDSLTSNTSIRRLIRAIDTVSMSVTHSVHRDTVELLLTREQAVWSTAELAVVLVSTTRAVDLHVAAINKNPRKL